MSKASQTPVEIKLTTVDAVTGVERALTADESMAELARDLAAECALAAMNGHVVTILCSRYFYEGVPVKVSPFHVILKGARFPLDTGEFKDKEHKSVMEFPSGTVVVHLQHIESFANLKRPLKN